ncbi:MAG: Ig-like domain-containing protein, partial [Deltaproteobacteria bacterium]
MATKKSEGKGEIVRFEIFFAMIFTWILFLAWQTTCFATTVTLQWDTNAESDLAGYKIYYQADASTLPFQGTGAIQGAAPVDVLKQTTATVGGLDPNHAYYFAVTAYNTSGIESSYSNIVAVPEMTSPTVSLTSPANNATVGGTVSVSATASDNVGVTKVEYYLNGLLQATDTTAPYVYSWNTTALAAGSYTLMTKAYDAAGNVGQSGNVSVSVVNDSISPTVTVTSPANNATVSGSVTIAANASDNVAVSRVEFFENGILLAASNVAPYSYSWNTAAAANGAHTLAARAYDAAGNVGQSSSVSVTLFNDTTLPTVSINSPLNGATVSGTTSVSATASDNVGVTKVEFYVNGALQSSSTSAPYSFSWNTAAAANGAYTLSAKAYDAAGNSGNSASVTVTVNNDTSPPTVSITSPLANA